MEAQQAPSQVQVQAAVQHEEEEEEGQSFIDLDVITKHGVTKTDVNKFKDAGFKTVRAHTWFPVALAAVALPSPLMGIFTLRYRVRLA